MVVSPSLAVRLKCLLSVRDLARSSPKIAHVSGETELHPGNDQPWKYASARAHMRSDPLTFETCGTPECYMYRSRKCNASNQT
eukprot:5779791-Pyramimonas_sp.AAC.1